MALRLLLHIKTEKYTSAFYLYTQFFTNFIHFNHPCLSFYLFVYYLCGTLIEDAPKFLLIWLLTSERYIGSSTSMILGEAAYLGN